MRPPTTNQIRLLAALVLLAALLACAPGQARAAGAVRCDAGASRIHLAAESHQAGLVIDFGDGRVQTFCIDLGEDGQATGEELLRASGLPVVIDYGFGIGGAVCKIDSVGSDFPNESCFSHCTLQPGESCMYWGYSQLVGDHWQFSQVGASDTVVHSGDVNGWAWGVSTIAQGAVPPLRTLAEICPPATATPITSLTPTLIDTATATQPPTPTPPATTAPYVARVITATPTVSATPTSTPTPSAVVAPTSVPVQATALPPPSPIAPPPPTATPSVTPSPPAMSVAQTNVATALPAPTPVNRSTGGTLRIQIPLIQHAAAPIASPTTGPTARAEASPATPLSVTPAPATPTPPRPAAPADDPTRNYPYFGGITAFLLAGWVMLRRGRRSP